MTTAAVPSGLERLPSLTGRRPEQRAEFERVFLMAQAGPDKKR